MALLARGERSFLFFLSTSSTVASTRGMMVLDAGLDQLFYILGFETMSARHSIVGDHFEALNGFDGREKKSRLIETGGFHLICRIGLKIVFRPVDRHHRLLRV